MRTHRSSRILSWCLAATLLTACVRPAGPIGPGPGVWIDNPPNGAALALAPILVQSHSSDVSAIDQVELYVNGELIRADLNTDSAARLVAMSQPWTPPGNGTYTLEVRARNADGDYGRSLPVTISVGVVSPTPVVTSTFTPTAPPQEITPTATLVVSPTPLTATPTASDTPTPTRTPLAPSPTPVPPTFTPTNTAAPQLQVSFSADSTDLQAGQCTTLHIRVQNASAVFLNGEGIAGETDRSVCPTQTTTYNLHVEAPSGNDDRSITVNVSAPPPTSPPTAPPTSPPPPQTPPAAPEGLSVAARTCQGSTYSVSLAWKDAANNETGYRVYRNGAQIATLGANATGFTDKPPAGGPYTYGVEAFNDAGASGRPTTSDPGCIF